MTLQMKRIVAWHPVLTDHQAYTYQQLAHQSGLPVVAQVMRLEDEGRRAQGWTDTQVTEVERQLIPSRDFLRYGLNRLLECKQQIHIFGSVFESPRMLFLLWLATRLRLECYLISEPYSQVPLGYFEDGSSWRERLKALLRPHLYRFYVLLLRGGLRGIFTISRLAVQQYIVAGMPPQRLFPFGYFVPALVEDNAALNALNDQPHTASKPIRLAFVGSLIARKGLPTLISAVGQAIARGVYLQLDVYGPGDPKLFDFNNRTIRYSGRIPFGKTQQFLSGYDLLILPSHYDGWGVVVNEAICAGVPVICSDQVGARVLIDSFNVGEVFPSGNKEALADLLVEIASDSSKLRTYKAACPMAAAAIQPSQAANYMLRVLSAPKDKRTLIPSPWYKPLE